MNSSSREQLVQILIHVLQDAKKQHCDRYFRHDCPLCIPFSSGVFLLFFTFLMKIIIDLYCGETPAHGHWKRLRVNLGTAEPAIVYPNLACLLCSSIPTSPGLQNLYGRSLFSKTCAVPLLMPRRNPDTYIQCCPGFLQEFLKLH